MSDIAAALQAGGAHAAAADALHDLVDLAPQRPVLLQRLISLVSQDPDNHEATRALLATHAERFPGRGVFRTRVARSLGAAVTAD